MLPLAGRLLEVVTATAMDCHMANAARPSAKKNSSYEVNGMKVILTNDIPNLGEEGDIIEVSQGYARNFLLPKGLVAMYNKTNLAILEGKKKAIEKRREEKRMNARSVKEKLASSVLSFSMPAGDNGKLFGAVTTQMVVEELEKLGLDVERKKIEIPGHTLKAVGTHKIRVRLYGEQEAEISVSIVPEGQEAQAAAPAGEEPAKAETAAVEEEVVASEEAPEQQDGE